MNFSKQKKQKKVEKPVEQEKKTKSESKIIQSAVVVPKTAKITKPQKMKKVEGPSGRLLLNAVKEATESTKNIPQSTASIGQVDRVVTENKPAKKSLYTKNYKEELRKKNRSFIDPEEEKATEDKPKKSLYTATYVNGGYFSKSKVWVNPETFKNPVLKQPVVLKRPIIKSKFKNKVWVNNSISVQNVQTSKNVT